MSTLALGELPTPYPRTELSATEYAALVGERGGLFWLGRDVAAVTYDAASGQPTAYAYYTTTGYLPGGRGVRLDDMEGGAEVVHRYAALDVRDLAAHGTAYYYDPGMGNTYRAYYALARTDKGTLAHLRRAAALHTARTAIAAAATMVADTDSADVGSPLCLRRIAALHAACATYLAAYPDTKE